MRYPVTIEQDGGTWLATFADIPEAITSGPTKEAALDMAQDALLTAMDFYFDDNRPVPMPSKAKAGQPVAELPASAWSKVLLLNEMLAQKVGPSELATRLHRSPQDVNRLVNIKHPTKIDTIAEALHALGKNLELRAV